MSECAAAEQVDPRPPDRAALLLGVDGLIHRLVRRANVHRGDVADVAQDAYVELLKAIDRFDPTRAGWNSFVGGVVRRTISNHWRCRYGDRRNPGGERTDPQPLPRADFLAADGPRDVLDALVEAEERELAEADGDDALAAFAELVAEVVRGPATDRLSARAGEVVRLVLAGNTPDEAAGQLGMAPKDAKLVIRNACRGVLNRMGAPARAAVLAKVGGDAPAWIRGLLDPEMRAEAAERRRSQREAAKAAPESGPASAVA